MEVYLVRHAVAASRDATRWPDDRDRPLTPDGENRFRKAARGLGRIAPAVDRVFASELARAWQTAQILFDELEWPKPEPWVELEPGHTPEEALRTLTGYGALGSVALVGHEPNLSELASLLLTGEDTGLDIEMKKGGVVCVAMASLPEPRSGTLKWAVPPKVLRAR